MSKITPTLDLSLKKKKRKARKQSDNKKLQLKETPCKDVSWIEKVENVETFPLSAFAWLFCYYVHQKQFMFCFASSFSSSRMLVCCFIKKVGWGDRITDTDCLTQNGSTHSRFKLKSTYQRRLLLSSQTSMLHLCRNFKYNHRTTVS